MTENEKESIVDLCQLANEIDYRHNLLGEQIAEALRRLADLGVVVFKPELKTPLRHTILYILRMDFCDSFQDGSFDLGVEVPLVGRDPEPSKMDLAGAIIAGGSQALSAYRMRLIAEPNLKRVGQRTGKWTPAIAEPTEFPADEILSKMVHCRPMSQQQAISFARELLYDLERGKRELFSEQPKGPGVFLYAREKE